MSAAANVASRRRALECGNICRVEDLQERPVTFDRPRRLTCAACSQPATLSNETYRRGTRGTETPCPRCGIAIDFVRSGLLIEDENDPALDHAQLPSLAWYHTGTDLDWPIAQYEVPGLDLLHQLMPPHAVREAEIRGKDKALHLGTYEAAIESMLRRIHDERLGASTFYLHRVCLHPGLSIDTTIRDETSDQAAQITQTELGVFDVARYVNIYESIGSISLAVRRTAIRSIQTVRLPLRPWHLSDYPAIASRLEALQRDLDQIAATHHPVPDTLDAIAFGLRDLHAPLPTDVARQLTERHVNRPSKILELAETLFLPETLEATRDMFTMAMRFWYHDQTSPATESELLEHYAALAATLTQAPDVITKLAESRTQALPM